MNSYELVNSCEKKLSDIFNEVDKICYINSKKVLDAFHKNNLSEVHFNSSTGYGYNDIGRDTIELIYKDIFKCESSLVRTQFISGTHALTTTLFGLLRPNDIMLSITGKPYDTLDEVIGLKDNSSSLASFNIKYMQVDLIDNDFDYDRIKEVLMNNKIKLIEIQRSKGYSTRESISIQKVEKVIKYIRSINKDIIIMIDNCYCEFVDIIEPTEVDADVVVGSLIKNLGGGITTNGAYVVGKEKYINLVSERLTVPGQGKEVGPSLGQNRSILQGLYFAPSVVASSIKVAILTSMVMESLGFNVSPKYNDKRVDIVQNIIFNDKDKLISYCNSIQSSSAIDSNATVVESDMPGYTDKIVMASGSFTQGSSIELSCDGPVRSPYIAYQQGSLTYEYGKIALINAIDNLKVTK
ncbi:MAG: methionine gamma-lyase family protein [Bacilli bacterium]|nr:methionine gamma-lyase family protein [Bacilli bacterium]